MKFKSEVQLEALNNATVDTDQFLVSDSSTVKYRTGAQLLSDLGIAGIYVPYTGATGNVDLGTHTLSSYNLIVNHTSGSGVAASITKGGNGEALTINKTSGSGNAMSVTGGLTSLVDLTLSSIANATTDTDRFIVSDSGAIKYRTGAQVLSDIGGQSALTNPITGTGTTNYVPKFTGTTSLGNSELITDGSGNLAVAQGNAPTQALNIYRAGSTQTVMAAGNSNTGLNGTYFGVDVNGNGIINTTGGFANIFSTNGSERMRITSTGNVGIGTSSPGDALEVNGNVFANGFNSIGTLTRYNTLGGVSMVGLAGNPYAILQAYSDAGGTGKSLAINPSGGNVGIGTNSPGYKLDVNGTISNNSAQNIIYASYDAVAALFQRVGTYGPIIQIGRSGVSNSTTIDYPADGTFAVSTAGSEKMRITSSGNVGIGTSSPYSKLDVSGAISMNGAYFAANNATYTQIYKAQSNSVGLYIGGAGDPQNYYDNTQHFFRSSGGGATYAIIDSSGNVGIGTTTPGDKLEVSGTGNIGIRIRTSTNTGSDYASLRYVQGATETAVTYVNLGNYITSVGGSERMRITSTGNVGIGTSVPATRFDVQLATNKHILFHNGNGEAEILGATDNGSAYAPLFISASPLVLNVNNGSNVGINISNPNSKLEVYDGDISVTTANSFSFLNSNRNFIPNTGGVSLGALRFRGYSTGTTYQVGSAIYSFSQDAWTSTSTPGYLSFQTTTSGSTSPSEKMVISSAGAVKFNSYGSGSFTGTATQKLAVDSSGNIIEIPIGAGPVDGSGTTNYVTKWTDADTIGNSQIFDNGTNVGIGTASPTYKLEISGALRSTGTLYSDNGSLAGALNLGQIVSIGSSWTSYANLVFTMHNGGGFSDIMKLQGNGNVGIGTSSPITKLHIDKASQTIGGTTPNGGLVITNLAGSNYALEFGTDTSLAPWIQSRNATSSTYYNLLLNPSGGNIGIGTTTPDSKLDVTGGDITVNTSGTGFMNFKYGSVGSESAIGTVTTDGINISYNASSALTFGTAGTTERMRITSGGNVGIGTSSPTQQFEVYKDNFRRFSIQYPTTYAVRLALGVNGYIEQEANGGYLTIAQQYATPGVNINFKIGTSEKVTIDYLGNVGIGTTTPDAKLHAVGSGIVNIVQSSNTVSYTQYYNSSTGTNSTSDGLTVGLNGIDAYIFSREAGSLVIGTSDTERMRITAAGNVGINCGGLNARLEVVATSGEAFRADVSGGAYRIIANQSGVLLDGDVGIGTTTPSQKLDVVGNAKVSGSVQVGDDSTTASAANVGATRYRSDSNNSYMDMVMQTGASTYAWVNVVQNTWV